jgi:hypothetical protein
MPSHAVGLADVQKRPEAHRASIASAPPRIAHRRHRLVFAASVEQLATTLDQIMISSADIAARAPFVPITITGGVLADEATQLFHR